MKSQQYNLGHYPLTTFSRRQALGGEAFEEGKVLGLFADAQVLHGQADLLADGVITSIVDCCQTGWQRPAG
jgi:hypothetical protein